MSSSKSSSSSSSSDSSSSNTPETPRKLMETLEEAPITISDIPEVPKCSPEISNTPTSHQSFPKSFKVPESPETPNVSSFPPSSAETLKDSKCPSSLESSEVLKSPSSSPETSKSPTPRDQNSPTSSPESTRSFKSLLSSPETFKAPRPGISAFPSSPETTKSFKSFPSSPEPSKVHKSPPSYPETSKAPKSPSSPETPDGTKIAKISTRFQELPDSPKFPSQPPPNIPKKILRHDFITKVPSTETSENPKSSSPSEPRVPHKKLVPSKSFTTSLQIFLEKQEMELERSKGYKKKAETKKTSDEDPAVEKGKSSDDDDDRDTKKDEINIEDGKESTDVQWTKELMKPPILSKFKKREEIKAEDESKNEEEENRMETHKEITQDKDRNDECDGVENEDKKYQESKRSLEETSNDEEEKIKEMNDERNDNTVTEVESEQSEKIVTEKPNEQTEPEKNIIDKIKHDGKDNEKIKKEEEEDQTEGKTSEVIIEEKSPREEMKGRESKKERKRKHEKRKESIRREEDLKDEKAQGLLYLKGKRPFNRWKEYFFVLDGMLLTYYRSQHDYEHLASMKGSLDLSLLENVIPKKPGIMRTHHPFCLSRRNLPFIELAAESKEDQERWIRVLLTVVGPRRQSCHSLEKTVKHSLSPQSKYSTLPTRTKETETGSCSSSITEEEEEAVAKRNEEEEDEEDEEGEEDEPEELVKPKKVMRVPIGMPLVKVDLNQVKLKKVERRDEDRDKVEEETTGSPLTSIRERQENEEAEERAAAEVFGVMLKRTKTREEIDERESSRERSPRDGSVSPSTTTTTTTTSIKRSLKQPVIPLNSSKLLAVPEGKDGHSPPRLSPASPKRAPSEKKRSPSPILPISRNVQALTKSAEETKPTQEDVATSPSSTSTEEGKLGAEVKMCHAQTSEVSYSDMVDVLVVEEVTENVAKVEIHREEIKKTKQEIEGGTQDDTRYTILTDKETVKKYEDEKDKDEENVSDRHAETFVREDNDGDNKDMTGALTNETAAPVNKNSESQKLQNTTTTSENLGSKENKIEGSAVTIDSSCVTPSTSPSSPASSVASSQSKSLKASISLSRSSDSVPPSPISGSFVPEKTPSPSTRTRQRSATLQDRHKEEEEGDVMLRYSPRHRSNTNESACSLLSEGSKRKSSKFKLFKNKLKGSSSVKEKKQDSGAQKEPKEKKRKASIAFSALLHGKKSKEVNLKPTDPEPQQDYMMNLLPPPPCYRDSAPTESPKTEPSPEPASPAVDRGAKQTPIEVCLTPPPIHLPCEEEPEDQVRPAMTSCKSEDKEDVIFRTPTTTINEPNYRPYSYTSTGSCEDVPPSIPEKTHRRASSPNHDVPRNNRPVTNLHLLIPESYVDEEDDKKKLDGYITEKQIEELLIAKENRDRRKRSLSRGQVFAKPDTVKGSLSVSPSDDWSNKRPSYTSFSSIESDEPLPTTNFLSFEQQSSSSGSIKGVGKADESERSSFYSEDGESVNQNGEGVLESVCARRALRPTDAIAANNRVSLTFPEFTVMEEDAHNSPETPRATVPPHVSLEESNSGQEFK